MFYNNTISHLFLYCSFSLISFVSHFSIFVHMHYTVLMVFKLLRVSLFSKKSYKTLKKKNDLQLFDIFQLILDIFFTGTLNFFCYSNSFKKIIVIMIMIMP